MDPKPKPTRPRGEPRPIGVPGPHLCRYDLPAERSAPHKCRPGSPGTRDAGCSTGYEAGRRRAIGVVAALSIIQRATVDSQDGCRYTTQNGPCVAIGFQPVDGSNRSRPGHAENPAPSGCRVRICAGTTSRQSGPPRTNADRAPPGRAMRAALPATRQAAGAPSAWSQPSQSSNARPRRWRDAGSPGRQSVTAAQKAGIERTLKPSHPRLRSSPQAFIARSE